MEQTGVFKEVKQKAERSLEICKKMRAEHEQGLRDLKQIEKLFRNIVEAAGTNNIFMRERRFSKATQEANQIPALFISIANTTNRESELIKELHKIIAIPEEKKC